MECNKRIEAAVKTAGLLAVLAGVILTGCRASRGDAGAEMAGKKDAKLESAAQTISETAPKEQVVVQDGTIFIENQKLSGSEEIDFQALEAVNPDIVGWIWIPGTSIDYPIVQAADNEAYMKTGVDGEPSSGGAVFLDYECQRDLSGPHTIIYGHNMKNGSMFHDVVRYKEKDYFKEHQYGVLYTPEETIYLKMVSVYYGEANPLYRKTEFQTEEEFKEFYQAMLTACSYAERTEEVPSTLFTLITCSYEFDNARTFLHAVRMSDEEAQAVLTSDIVVRE